MPPSALIAVWHMAQWPRPCDKISAAVPFGRLLRVWLELAFGEEQGSPAEDQRTVVVGKSQVVRAVRLLHWRDRLEIGENRIAVGTRHLGIGSERHRRIKQAAVGKAARMHHLVELVARPLADAGLVVRRDVGGVERAERRRHRAAASEEFACRRCVAGNAVAGAGEIFAVVDRSARGPVDAPAASPPTAPPTRTRTGINSKAEAKLAMMLGGQRIEAPHCGSLPQGSGVL